MVKRGPTNPRLAELIEKLKAEKKGIWQSAARFLSRPTRKRPWINLSKISRYAGEGETILVPGKVLAAGDLTKPVTIAAWKFSEKAVEKIRARKGKVMSIPELMKTNPSGKGVRVMLA